MVGQDPPYKQRKTIMTGKPSDNERLKDQSDYLHGTISHTTPTLAVDDPPEPRGDHNAARPAPAFETTAGPPQPPPPITEHPQPRHATPPSETRP